jgi:hypothetical protein
MDRERKHNRGAAMSGHEAADAAAEYMRPLESELGPSEDWPACQCGPDERCFDCATDDELLVALGYEPLDPEDSK